LSKEGKEKSVRGEKKSMKIDVKKKDIRQAPIAFSLVILADKNL